MNTSFSSDIIEEQIYPAQDGVSPPFQDITYLQGLRTATYVVH